MTAFEWCERFALTYNALSVQTRDWQSGLLYHFPTSHLRRDAMFEALSYNLGLISTGPLRAPNERTYFWFWRTAAEAHLGPRLAGIEPLVSERCVNGDVDPVLSV